MQKTAFMLKEGRVVNSVVGCHITPTAFKVGEEFTLSCPLDLRPLGVVPKGASFTVEDHDHDNGLVTLKSDCEHCALEKWCQQIMLKPYETDDIVSRLVRTKHHRVSPRVQNIALAAACVAVCVTATVFAADMASALRGGDPMVYHESYFVQDTVREGGKLYVHVSEQVSRTCEWSTTRYWYQGDTLVSRSTQPAPIFPVTNVPIQVTSAIPVPVGMQPGNYRFVGVVRADCGHGDVFSRTGLDQKFTIVPRNS